MSEADNTVAASSEPGSDFYSDSEIALMKQRRAKAHAAANSVIKRALGRAPGVEQIARDFIEGWVKSGESYEMLAGRLLPKLLRDIRAQARAEGAGAERDRLLAQIGEDK